MIKNFEKKKVAADLKKLSDMKEFEALVRVVNELLVAQRDANIVGVNEFDTLKYAFQREGAITILQALKMILENPEAYVSESQ